MTPIEVDPEVLAAAGVALGDDAAQLAAALRAFSAAVTGFNAGEDTAGIMFGYAYGQAARQVADVAMWALKACRRVGFGIGMSAANYAAAEAAATVGGPASSVSVPVLVEDQAGVNVPSPFGGVPAPPLWILVEFFVGSVWPNGDPDAMRAAARVWQGLGEALARIAARVPAPKAKVSAQRIPEQSRITDAIDDIADKLGGVAGVCTTLAGQLKNFAGEVQATQDAVRDLLKRLSPSGMWDMISGLFSGDNPLDEIKAVAADIAAVLGNFGREAEARVDTITQGTALLESYADSLEDWISQEFPAIAASLVNEQIDSAVGGLKSVLGMVGGLVALDPERFLYNPQGAWQSWKGTLESLQDFAALGNPATWPGLLGKIALDPQGALETYKGMIDWDDLSGEHPMRGVGYDVTTLATMLIPGLGEVKPAATAAEVAGIETRAAATAGREGAAGLPRPQIKPTERPTIPGEQPRPGASPSEPRPGVPTSQGTPVAEPRPEPAPGEPRPGAPTSQGTPVAEPRPEPAPGEPRPGAQTPGTAEHPGTHDPVHPPGETTPGATEHPGSQPPQPVPPDAGPPPALPPDSPMFDGYDPIPPGPEFTNPDGSLHYPNDLDRAKPYAIPGTVVPNVEIPPGTILDRFGGPAGGWMSPEGTPFAERGLPPSSAAAPYYQYEVLIDPAAPGALPPGWSVEQSQAAPWFHQPGGGIQYRIIDRFGKTASVEELEYLGIVRRVN